MLAVKNKIYSGQFIISNNANDFRETADKIRAEFKQSG
jgi:hypothetical protein